MYIVVRLVVYCECVLRVVCARGATRRETLICDRVRDSHRSDRCPAKLTRGTDQEHVARLLLCTNPVSYLPYVQLKSSSFFFLFSFLREKFLYRLSNPHPSLLFYLHFCFSIDSPPFYSFFIFVLFNFNVNQVNSRSLFFVLFIEILF